PRLEIRRRRTMRRAAGGEGILRRKSSHPQFSDRRISEAYLRLLRRRRAAAAAALPRLRKRHALGRDLRAPVQLRQQSRKRPDPYPIHASRIRILQEPPAGNSRHHCRGKRLGRAAHLAFSQRPALHHPAWPAEYSLLSRARSRSSRLARAHRRRQPRELSARRDPYSRRRRRRSLQEPPQSAHRPARPLAEVRIQDIDGPERANIVWIQDYATQVGQGPLELRKKEMLGRSDRALILIRKIWERELQALADGRPLKQWKRTETLAGLSSQAND